MSTGDGTEDCDGHGTIVAGIIGAAPDPHDANAFSGIAPDATIIGIRQSSNKFRAADDPSGSGFGDVDTLAMAVRTAADMGATVINVSSVACVPAQSDSTTARWAPPWPTRSTSRTSLWWPPPETSARPANAADQNPAADPRATRPAELDGRQRGGEPGLVRRIRPDRRLRGSDGAPSQFSLAGPWVDVAAPGEDVVSLDPDGEGLVDTARHGRRRNADLGTSYAAPVVTGIVALVRSRITRIDRATGHAAHRRHGAPTSCGLGSRRRPRHRRRTRGGDRRSRTSARRDWQPPDPGRSPASRRPMNGPGKLPFEEPRSALALSVALVAMTTSATRLRRRSDAVPHD